MHSEITAFRRTKHDPLCQTMAAIWRTSMPVYTQPRPQGAFPWLWSLGKAPWGQGCVYTAYTGPDSSVSDIARKEMQHAVRRWRRIE